MEFYCEASVSESAGCLKRAYSSVNFYAVRTTNVNTLKTYYNVLNGVEKSGGEILSEICHSSATILQRPGKNLCCTVCA